MSYSGKQNEANGEDNRYGINENLIWNYGAEGPTDRHPKICPRLGQTSPRGRFGDTGAAMAMGAWRDS